jgi:nucleoside-diphosphate-sugar epimerase
MTKFLVGHDNRRVLVTGANGFVGRALCAELAGRDYDVRGAVRNLCGVGDKNLTSIEVGDIGPATNWSRALEGEKAVVHLAARVHVMRDTEAEPLTAFRTVNVDGTLNLARQAAAAGVKRFVFVSSVKVNGEFTQPGYSFAEVDVPDPQDAYGQSKHEAELGLRQLGAETSMEVVIIRPPLIYGPGVKANFSALIRAVQRGWPLPLGAVHNRRSMVALDNLVDFIATCLVHPQAGNQTFFVSDGRDMSITELLRALANVARIHARLVPVPVWALRTGAAVLGKGAVIQRLCGNLQVDIGKACNLLDWAPPISVDEGLRRTIEKTKNR